MRIALINPPFASVYRPSIALTQLADVARAETGAPAQIHYLNLAIARLVGVELYESVADRHYMQGFGDWVFRALAYPDIDDNETEYFSRMYSGSSSPHCDQAERVAALRPEIYAAVQKYVDDHDLASSDIVGLTSMFSQNMACFAIARLVKERNPGATVIMGGANCEDPMGAAIRDNVKWIDYVFSGPSIISFREFLRRHRDTAPDGPEVSIAGVFAQGGRPARRSLPLLDDPGPARLVGARNDIDEPISLDYDGYLDEFDGVFPDSAKRPSLLFETSRGCWWGERSQCTFCGLNGTGMSYEAMSPERAVAHITALFRYAGRVRVLSGVDNILPRSFINQVLPRLRTPAGMSLFFEVKVGLTDQDMAMLAAAGVRVIQPGIESLSTATLHLMRKGTSAFQNIMFLRSARSAAIQPSWQILVGFPGEEPEVYQKYLRDLPLLTHLHPPMNAIPIRFDRYSPYFEDPAKYGLDLHPMQFYQLVYPVSQGTAADLAYYFYDVTPDPAYQRTCDQHLTGLQDLVRQWQDRWQAGQRPELCVVPDSLGLEGAVILDSRAAGRPVFRSVSAAGLAILDALRRPLTPNGVAEKARLDPEQVRAEIAGLRADGLLFEERGKYLSLLTSRPGPRSSQ
jgi:magnesium-protoporphyrin IX monomethyl ester (oxidative) cyclase